MEVLRRYRSPVCVARQVLGHGVRGCAAIVAAYFVLNLAAADGVAQSQPAKSAEKDEPVAAHLKRLRGLQTTIEKSKSQRRKILTQLETVRNDRARLNAALLETTARIQKSEQQIIGLGGQLKKTSARVKALRGSLYARRDILANILAALQRMGRRPPPALLISPGDILRAVRTSILLGAVVPELRAEAEILTVDLQQLGQVRTRAAAERQRLQRSIQTLEGERIKLSALIEARQGSIKNVESALSQERRRAAELAGEATTLKNLIGNLEKEISAARRAAKAARAAQDRRRRLAAKGKGKAINPFANRARLAPVLAFTDTKGMLPLPVAGKIYRKFGDISNFGGKEKGFSLVTNPNALVSSPADGWVVYAGPYRSYGHLLIINAGDDYYIVLAGIGRLVVDVGQFVLAGEPIGSMGDGSVRTVASIAIGVSEPVLYIEFRKSGTAVDSGPWWASPALKKVRG